MPKRAGGTQLRALLRDGRDAAVTLAGPGEHPQVKRLLMHVGAFNLSLALRKRLGAGTPRGLADAEAVSQALVTALGATLTVIGARMPDSGRRRRIARSLFAVPRPVPPLFVAA